MATDKTWTFVDSEWDKSVIPLLCDYIKIPNVSPMYDKDWATNGLMDQAVELLHGWAKNQKVNGFHSEVVRLEGKTPVIFVIIDASNPDVADANILMYGHLDKQPPLTETWAEGLHPYKPVIKDGKLYGRGGADDGYAICAAILSVKALQEQGIPHGRVVLLVEASEESGSFDLPDYINHLAKQIGTPSLIICLDSGSGNYEQLWTTTSLRGLIAGNLSIKIINEGSHSGHASGIVPSTFRILRTILDRIEDTTTGEVKIKELFVEIPPKRIEEVKKCAEGLGERIHKEFSWVDGGQPVSYDLFNLLLNRTWRPTICVTGVDGIPPLSNAGNVLRSFTSVKLSVRIPPTAVPESCAEALKAVLTANPPYGAKITFDVDKVGPGFDAPEFAPWLETAMNKASNFFCKKPANYIGEGGSIPFMGMLKSKFPQAQFVITGLLGPESNAHGPNEFLHIKLGKMVTACVSSIVADHAVQFSKKH